MAAGVSISADYLLGFTCLFLVLVGTTELREASYRHDGDSPDSTFTSIDFEQHLNDDPSWLYHRRRREADDTDSTSPDGDTTNNNISSSTPIPSSTLSTSTVFSTISSTPSPSSSTITVAPSVPTTTVFMPTSGNGSQNDNFTEIEEKELNHTYYRSTPYYGEQAKLYWIDLDSVDWQQVTHKTLSDSHRTAATVKMSFDFIFYGHQINQVTIATGGFLYMSSFLHQWLTATQYIAPLMANFDTQVGNNSHVHYADNGSMFIVQWQDVHIQDDPSVGHFNFQVHLYRGGKVVFAYKEVPVTVDTIPSGQHPVKVGLSDAYYIDRQISNDVRRRTIYEYHRVAVPLVQVKSNAAIVILPNPTCAEIEDCGVCVTANIGFNCQWCNVADRCSDGLDRQRQDWIQRGCSTKLTTSADKCPSGKGGKKGHKGFNEGSVIALILIVTAVISLMIWFVYAYKNPQSRSGMWLIEHRPSNLKDKLNKVRFWKNNSSAGEKYEVSMQPEGDSVA